MESASRRMLVIDDDEMIGALVQAIGRTSGFETRLTTELESFFVAVQAWRPDLIFLDLTMPQMPGEAVLRRLAEQSCAARIIVSSGAEPERLSAAADLARQCGLAFGGTLRKPFTPAALRALLAHP